MMSSENLVEAYSKMIETGYTDIGSISYGYDGAWLIRSEEAGYEASRTLKSAKRWIELTTNEHAEYFYEKMTSEYYVVWIKSAADLQ